LRRWVVAVDGGKLRGAVPNPREWLRKIAVGLLGLWICSPTFADSVPPPRPFEVDSRTGEFLLRMTPPPDEDEPGRGEVYRRGEDESPLWSVSWYARQVFLSDDGRCAVRVNSRPHGVEELAVGISCEGGSSREWAVEDLVGHPEVLERTASGVVWLASTPAPGFSPGGTLFRVWTAEGRRLEFDLERESPPRSEEAR
jgi:hypothetical protein